jgi:hypothetical protein
MRLCRPTAIEQGLLDPPSRVAQRQLTVACRVVRPQYLKANAEDIFYNNGD